MHPLLWIVLVVNFAAVFMYRVHVDDRVAERAHELKMAQIKCAPDK